MMLSPFISLIADLGQYVETPNALPVYFWHAKQLQTQTSLGAPSIAIDNRPHVRLAWRIINSPDADDFCRLVATCRAKHHGIIEALRPLSTLSRKGGFNHASQD